MQPLVVAVILVGVPLAWLVVFAAYAYLDAPNHGMDRRKWALICFFVPLFGFFAYVFERGERDYDPSEDPYAQGSDARTAGFAVHERRRERGSVRPGPRRTTLTKAKTKRKTSGTTRTGSISTTTAETRREPTEPTAVETATPCRAAPTAVVVRGRTRHRGTSSRSKKAKASAPDRSACSTSASIDARLSASDSR